MRRCLAYELSHAGIVFERQKEMPVAYKGMLLNCGYRFDFLIENSLILELKAVARLEAIHEAQLLTYLKLSGNYLGLLINFNVPLLKDGIKRMTVGNLFLDERLNRK